MHLGQHVHNEQAQVFVFVKTKHEMWQNPNTLPSLEVLPCIIPSPVSINLGLTLQHLHTVTIRSHSILHIMILHVFVQGKTMVNFSSQPRGLGCLPIAIDERTILIFIIFCNEICMP